MRRLDVRVPHSNEVYLRVSITYSVAESASNAAKATASPAFTASTASIASFRWRVYLLPERIQCRWFVDFYICGIHIYHQLGAGESKQLLQKSFRRLLADHKILKGNLLQRRSVAVHLPGDYGAPGEPATAKPATVKPAAAKPAAADVYLMQGTFCDTFLFRKIQS